MYEGCPRQVFRTCKSAGLPAVNDVSVGVKVECFGLLGNNGETCMYVVSCFVLY